jgi:hypothetical protein
LFESLELFNSEFLDVLEHLFVEEGPRMMMKGYLMRCWQYCGDLELLWTRKLKPVIPRMSEIMEKTT